MLSQELNLMKMRLISLTAACSLALAAALSAQTARGMAPSQAAQGDKAKVLASVQGAWTMTSSNGQDMTAAGAPAVVVTITGDKYVQTADGQVVEKGSFKFDETKKPMTLDITIAEGENAGKVQLGIWELSGNKMTGKLGEPGTPTRPTNFNPEEGFFTFVMVKK
jgi:uncharacterized protein (TIGR03067 family)